MLPAYLDGQDDPTGPWFCFVNLPAGDYELTLAAEGRPPSTTRYRIVPGEVTPMSAIVMPMAR